MHFQVQGWQKNRITIFTDSIFYTKEKQVLNSRTKQSDFREKTMTEKQNPHEQKSNSEQKDTAMKEQQHASEINVFPEKGMYLLNQVGSDSKIIDSYWKAL